MKTPDWRWDEMRQVGTDYTDLAQVEAYDARMGVVRNVDAENREILELLALPRGASLLEIGCGTGRLARAAASAGLRVTAIDVSPIMLEYVQRRAEAEGLPAIDTRNAGFLTLEFEAETFDAAVSGLALHHLPDAWKLVALRNVARVLKPGGHFLLRDVVFTLAEKEAPEDCFERFAAAFPSMRTEVARHIAQEYSTYDWILEGLLLRAGFTLRSKSQPAESFLAIHCFK